MADRCGLCRGGQHIEPLEVGGTRCWCWGCNCDEVVIPDAKPERSPSDTGR